MDVLAEASAGERLYNNLIDTTNILMDLAIQPCVRCAELHGQSSDVGPHSDLSRVSFTGPPAEPTEERYTCAQCAGLFARTLDGKPARRVWMLVNAAQH